MPESRQVWLSTEPANRAELADKPVGIGCARSVAMVVSWGVRLTDAAPESVPVLMLHRSVPQEPAKGSTSPASSGSVQRNPLTPAASDKAASAEMNRWWICTASTPGWKQLSVSQR